MKNFIEKKEEFTSDKELDNNLNSNSLSKSRENSNL